MSSFAGGRVFVPAITSQLTEERQPFQGGWLNRNEIASLDSLQRTYYIYKLLDKISNETASTGTLYIAQNYCAWESTYVFGRIDFRGLVCIKKADLVLSTHRGLRKKKSVFLFGSFLRKLTAIVLSIFLTRQFWALSRWSRRRKPE